jgi:hypothetical protein
MLKGVSCFSWTTFIENLLYTLKIADTLITFVSAVDMSLHKITLQYDMNPCLSQG